MPSLPRSPRRLFMVRVIRRELLLARNYFVRAGIKKRRRLFTPRVNYRPAATADTFVSEIKPDRLVPSAVFNSIGSEALTTLRDPGYAFLRLGGGRGGGTEKPPESELNS